MNHIYLTVQMYFVEPASRRFQSMETNETIESIFDFLSEYEQVVKMISSTLNKRPAMEAVIEEIEQRFVIDIEYNYRNRQIIGSMIRYIMGHYGHRAGKAVKLKKGRFIKTAIVFKKFWLLWGEQWKIEVFI